jgi:hypothetical protein
VSYRIVGLLGRGGSAVVELALDGDGRRVATKRLALTGSAAQMEVARHRLRREAEILSRLAHPGIVPILDVIDDGSEVILVFPALEENLEDRVERLGPLPPAEVERIGRALIEALAVAHRHGVVHRDIKPANVLFDEWGRPALADFGMAVTQELTAGLTLAGTVVGTPMWMAPEQARGEAAAPASDVFSLAATLGFAATGSGPYAAGPAAAVMGRAARNEILPLGSAVPDELWAPLARMLDPRPERRPSAAALLGGLHGTGVSPIPEPDGPAKAAFAHRFLASGLVRLLGDPRPRPVEASRRRRLARLAGGASVVIVVGLVVAVGLTGPGSGRGRAASKAPAAVCTPLPYFPCGASVPAAHTDGTSCDRGWYDMDGQANDGCEARSDFAAGTTLTSTTAQHANLVPASARDTFPFHVSGSALRLCWGTLHVTLTAPARTAEQLTLWKGTAQVATAVSVNGNPATASVAKPSCFGADSEDLRATISVVAATAGASATNFTLTRDSGWS